MPYEYNTVTAIQSQIPVIPVQLTQVEVEARVAEYVQGVVRVASEIAREKQFQSRVAEYVQGVVHGASQIAREKLFQSRVADHSEGTGCSQPQKPDITAVEVMVEPPTTVPKTQHKEKRKLCPWKGKRIVMPRILGAMRNRRHRSRFAPGIIQMF